MVVVQIMVYDVMALCGGGGWWCSKIQCSVSYLVTVCGKIFGAPFIHIQNIWRTSSHLRQYIREEWEANQEPCGTNSKQINPRQHNVTMIMILVCLAVHAGHSLHPRPENIFDIKHQA